mmetsp:Transcript_9948/g.21360  ORF Transcript_9948/g.21360 Transcript_9948/m.21360 type:complete len:162 (-) Transcript_9948:561-1046(-)
MYSPSTYFFDASTNANANASDKHNDESIVRFRNGDRLRLVKWIGKGGITDVFEAVWYSSATKNETVVVAKINPDEDMFYSNIETDILLRLQEPPTISNIPEIYFAVRSGPCPIPFPTPRASPRWAFRGSAPNGCCPSEGSACWHWNLWRARPALRASSARR